MAALYFELLSHLTVFSHSQSHRSRLYTWHFSPRAKRNPVPMPSAQKRRFPPLLEWTPGRVRVRVLLGVALPACSWLSCFTPVADQEDREPLFRGQYLHRGKITAGDKLNSRDIAKPGQKQTVNVTLCLQVCKHNHSPRTTQDTWS